MKFTVELRDLRAALTAVLPFASTDGELEHLARVRFWPGPVNLTVAATNTFVVGLAVVSSWGGDVDDTGDEPAPFDLPIGDVKKLLAVHKVRKVTGEDVEQSVLFDVTADTVITSDVSGLFAGSESLSLPLPTLEDRFPNLPAYVGTQVHRADTNVLAFDADLPIGLAASALSSFVTASKAYGAPPMLRLVETSPGRFVAMVTVSESFIGLLTTRDVNARMTEADERAVDAWPGWVARLPHGDSERYGVLEQASTHEPGSPQDPTGPPGSHDDTGDGLDDPDEDPPPRRDRSRHLESI